MLGAANSRTPRFLRVFTQTSLLAVLSASASALAATFFVDPRATSTTCNSYSPLTRQCGSGNDTAFTTISAASAAAGPGDTIVLRAGSYPEQLRPANSGAPGSPVIYRNFIGETVLVGAASISDPAILLSDCSYIVVEGIHVEDRPWIEARNTHHCVIQNCVFLRTPASGTTGNARFISATFNRILNCTFLEGQDNLLLIDANNNLVEGCTLGAGRHSVLSIRCSDFNIIRGNTLYNPLQKVSEVYDCGAGTSAVANSFDSTHHNVFENNFFGPCELGGGYHDTTSNGNGIQYAGQDGIIRRNVFFQCNVGLGLQVYGDEALFNMNNRVYHNVFFANKGAGIATRSANVSAIYKNNILFQNGGCINGCVAATSPGQIVYRTEASSPPLGVGGFAEKNDLLFQTPGQRVMEAEFARAGKTIAEFNAAFPGELFGTLEVDPMFVSAAKTNFALSRSSSLIDAGAFLTRTLLAGAGPIIPVQDSSYFIDGFSIPGEVGDSIQLEGQTEAARVLQVDYVLNSLVLDRPLIWSDGQGVALAFNGPAPDIGAFEVEPTGLRLLYYFTGTTFTLTWLSDSGYVLLSSPDVEGPYSPVASADGSYSETPAASARFFQLRTR